MFTSSSLLFTTALHRGIPIPLLHAEKWGPKTVSNLLNIIEPACGRDRFGPRSEGTL